MIEVINEQKSFRDAWLRQLTTTDLNQKHVLNATWIDTPLGPLLTIADETALYLLEFADFHGLAPILKRLKQKSRSSIIPGRTKITQMIEGELQKYFAGELREFETPLAPTGSPFQREVWDELRKIPYGKTCSYSDMAIAIGKPAAVRAAASANGANPIVIAIPCHRVINTSGELGGYGGGLGRKMWLIEHEKRHFSRVEFYLHNCNNHI